MCSVRPLVSVQGEPGPTAGFVLQKVDIAKLECWMPCYAGSEAYGGRSRLGRENPMLGFHLLRFYHIQSNRIISDHLFIWKKGHYSKKIYEK